MIKIAYLFKQGRRSRINSKNKFPTEFFYGFIELKKSKLNIDFIEDYDLGLAYPLPMFSRLLNKFSILLPNIPVGQFICLFYKKFKILINTLNSEIVVN